MDAESLTGALERVQALASEVTTLRRILELDHIDARDRDYLSRCFDLLDMEIGAVRQYLRGLG